jgi:hypothetical protein
MVVLIFDSSGATLDSVGRENFISCEKIGHNEMVVKSAVTPSIVQPNGIHATQFEILPHNEHAIAMLNWTSIGGA